MTHPGSSSMTQAGPARTRRRPAAGAQRRSSIWAAPLVAGLCCGLAFGLTQRLVRLNVGELIRFGQRFDVQVFPGTTLKSLQLRFGDQDLPLQGGLAAPDRPQALRLRPATAEPDPLETPTADAEADPGTELRAGSPEPQTPPAEEPRKPVPDSPPPPTAQPDPLGGDLPRP